MHVQHANAITTVLLQFEYTKYTHIDTNTTNSAVHIQQHNINTTTCKFNNTNAQTPQHRKLQ